jgi:phytoene synthase
VVALDAAYAQCLRLAREHYENFPVASWLLPRAARPHVAAVYAFARGADDLADEGTTSPAARLEALAQWRSWLHAAAAGRRVPDARHAFLFDALADTIHRKALPVTMFDDLLSAFTQDVTVTRYRTWTDVLDYCRRSANPVGRLVLRICGYEDPALDGASDQFCTALQLTNFWQDLAQDWRRGRLYLPDEESHAAGATIESFDPAALTPEWRLALARALDRTRSHFDAGRWVCDAVSGRLRYELRFTWLGGTRLLDRLRAATRVSQPSRPVLGVRDALPIVWHALAWRPAPDPR